jgi:phosphatidylglycerol:prolipoprotein diacylglycerol transferase
MLIHWSVDPVLMRIGPLAISWYGLLFVGAFVVGQRVLGRIFAAQGVEAAHAERLFLYGLVGAVVGARLAHVLAYDPAFYLAHPLDILKTWEGGLASHGGVVGLLAGLAIGVRRIQPPLALLWVADCVAIPAAIGAAMIRLANFVNSEIIGIPTAGHWGVVFTSVDPLPRHPVQLYEAAVYLVIALLLWAVYRRQGLAVRGRLSGGLLVSVFAARIGLEYFKVPQAAYESGFEFSVGQYLSVPFVVAGLALLLMRAGPAAHVSRLSPVHRNR